MYFNIFWYQYLYSSTFWIPDFYSYQSISLLQYRYWLALVWEPVDFVKVWKQYSIFIFVTSELDMVSHYEVEMTNYTWVLDYFRQIFVCSHLIFVHFHLLWNAQNRDAGVPRLCPPINASDWTIMIEISHPRMKPSHSDAENTFQWPCRSERCNPFLVGWKSIFHAISYGLLRTVYPPVCIGLVRLKV